MRIKGQKWISLLLVFAFLFGMVGLGVFPAAAYAEGNIHVTIRVEGTDHTILPETVVEVPAGAGAIDVLQAAGLEVTYSGGMITAIEGVEGDPFWSLNPWIEAFQEGDSVVYAGNGSLTLTQIALPGQANPGASFTVTVTEEDGSAVSGAEVIYYREGGHRTPAKTGIKTNASGQAVLSIAEPGDYYVAAEKSDMVRAKAKAIQVKTAVQVNRIAGNNRYDTSAKTALQAYPNGAETVIIARGDDQGNFTDALAASYLAGVEDTPILLTSPDSLPQEIEEAIEELEAQKAYVLGGELAVSQAVVNRLNSLGLEVERITGQNRYATVAAIAAKGGPAETAIVVNGFAPADSLVAGPPACGKQYPILLVETDSVPAETEEAVAGLGIEKIIVIGGENAVSEAVYNELQATERCSGQSRIETSLDVAEKLFAEAKDFSIVGYLSLSDAVGAAVNGNPIIYVKDNISDVEDYLTEAIAPDTRFTIFGGTQAVSKTVEDELKELLQ